MNLLQGKKILITGVANEQSIAWGIAKALHAEGATLAFSCISNHVRRLKRFVNQVDSDIIIPCDVQKDADIEASFDAVGRAFDGKLDGLVHSIAFAQIEDLEGEFVKTSREGFLLAHNVSAYSLVAMARAARPLMKNAGGGSIITLTFNGSSRVVPNYNVMGPAKAALDSSVLYLANDLGKDGIRVNAISAGPIKTSAAMAVKGFEKSMDVLGANLPLGRNLTQDDVGGPAVFLLSHLARGVTGAILPVDAGMSIMAGVFAVCSVCPIGEHHHGAVEGKSREGAGSQG